MIAKRLEAIVAQEYRSTNISRRIDAEMVQRFQNMREFGLLPKSRGKNAESLSAQEIVQGILSIVSEKPGFAGVAAKVLVGLRPVGGPSASFKNGKTLGESLASVIEDPAASESVLEVRVSSSEIHKNSHGLGIIVFRDGKKTKYSYYVRKEAVSLMQSGKEQTFDPREIVSSIVKDTVFLPKFFAKIESELRREKAYQSVRESAGVGER